MSIDVFLNDIGFFGLFFLIILIFLIVFYLLLPFLYYFELKKINKNLDDINNKISINKM